MPKYQNLRSAINFSEDEEDPIVAEDNSAVDDALAAKMKKLVDDTDPVDARLKEQLGKLSGLQRQDEALGAGMKKLLAQTPTRAQAAATRALEAMSKKQSVSEEDLLSAAGESPRTMKVDRKQPWGLDLREKTMPVDESQPWGLDLREPSPQQEKASRLDRQNSKKTYNLDADLADAVSAANLEQDGQEFLKQGRAADAYGFKRDDEPVSRKGPVEDPEFDTYLASLDKEGEKQKPHVYVPPDVAQPKQVTVEDVGPTVLRRGKSLWSDAHPGTITQEQFAQLPPEKQAEVRQLYWVGPQGNFFKIDGEVPEAARQAPVEGEANQVASAGAKTSSLPSPALSAKAEAPSPGQREIPSALLERLRAARMRDDFDRGSSSLGRLLSSTSAQFSKSPTTQAELQNYLQGQAKNEGQAFKREQEYGKAEKDIRDEEEENSTESDVALTGQHIARQLGMPEEQVQRITGKSAKILIAMLGNKTKLDLQDKKEAGNTGRQDSKNKTALDIAKLRSQDKHYDVDARKAVAMLRYRGVGPRSNDPKVQAKFDADVAKFVKSLPSGFGATLDNLSEIGDIIARNGGSAPGVGFFASLVPNDLAGEFYGDDAEQLRALADNIYNEYIKGNYGSAFSKTEERRFNAAMGAIKAGVREKRFLSGLKEVADLISSKVEQGAAGYSDKVVKTAVDRGLHTIPNSKREALRPPEQQAPAPQSAPKAEMVTVTNGKETLRIPASRLAEAEKDGYRRVE